jgi:hypothetical protein
MQACLQTVKQSARLLYMLLFFATLVLLINSSVLYYLERGSYHQGSKVCSFKALSNTRRVNVVCVTWFASLWHHKIAVVAHSTTCATHRHVLFVTSHTDMDASGWLGVQCDVQFC